MWRARNEELEQLFVDRNPTLNSKTLKARYGPFLNQGDILASLKESAVLRILRTYINREPQIFKIHTTWESMKPFLLMIKVCIDAEPETVDSSGDLRRSRPEPQKPQV